MRNFTTRERRKYIPPHLSPKDKVIQMRELIKSHRSAKKGKYPVRKRVKSFKGKKSTHVANAKRIYGIKKITPEILAKVTGCPVSALRQILRKGRGAYVRGSRPNQTHSSWAIARLASAVTGGKAAKVDAHLLRKCKHLKRSK